MNALIYLINNLINITVYLLYILWGQCWDIRQLKCLLGRHSGSVVITVASQKEVLNLNPSCTVSAAVLSCVCSFFPTPQVENVQPVSINQFQTHVILWYSFLYSGCICCSRPLLVSINFNRAWNSIDTLMQPHQMPHYNNLTFTKISTSEIMTVTASMGRFVTVLKILRYLSPQHWPHG